MKTKNSSKKRRIYGIISAVSLTGFMISAIILCYPLVSDKWNRYRDMVLIANYNQTIANEDPQVFEEELERANEYNRMLYVQGKNIITQAQYEYDAQYESLLNVLGNGVMGYLEVPTIGVTEPLYHYSTEISLGEGVGHIHGSSLPIGGSSTHSVLTGHRGLPNQKFFSDLDKLESGDCFYIHILGHTYAYRVYKTEVVLPTDVSGLLIESNKDIVSLVTCEPYGVNTHRLIVTGERIEFDESNVNENGFVTIEKHRKAENPEYWFLVGLMIFTGIMVIPQVIRKIAEKAVETRNKRKSEGGS